jgi:hypothetical protein
VPSTARLLRRCNGVVKWLQVVRIEDRKIKIRRVNVRHNLDSYVSAYFDSVCM